MDADRERDTQNDIQFFDSLSSKHLKSHSAQNSPSTSYVFMFKYTNAIGNQIEF